MKQQCDEYDVVVCGGGMAGFCAAVAAARQGAKTCLVQNRPVFGGNSSSEIGVTPHGAAAFHAYARETGIVSELLIEERCKNHADIYENGWTNSVWDMVLYDLATQTPNLSFHLNTDVCDVRMDDKRTISAIIARTLNAEVELTLTGKLFIDCTGDGVVSHLAGCNWRMGSEGRDEFGEPHAPAEASDAVMGSSLHFRARNVGIPTEFKAPDWAMHYDDASFFYEQGRIPKEERGGYWWIEIGIPYHTIHDNETIRHELTRHVLGVWDWMKNRDPVMKERTRNYALDWIGQVPGKRESRRVMGRYLMTELDVAQKKVFEDEIAFGGWFIDLHTPGGLLAESSEPAAKDSNYDSFSEYAVRSYCGPYGIPLRILLTQDVDNLMLAGRNVSATHAALGTVRVMATTALLGQAAGTAAALAIRDGLSFDTLNDPDARFTIQQRLLRDGCFLLNARNEDPADLARLAQVTASSSAKLAGAGPDVPGAHDGLAIWRDQPQYDIEALESRRGQLIAVGTEGLHSISLCLENTAKAPEQVEARLYPVEHIWDYRAEPTPPLATTVLTVPPGGTNWVDWPVDLASSALPAGRFVRVDVLPNPAIRWLPAGCIVPGHVASYQISNDRMRRFASGNTLSFKVNPPQSAYEATNVISGVTRPYEGTNLWRSNPDESLPQWIELGWPEPKKIAHVELTFPGHLLREYHAYAPFYRDAQIPSDYRIQIQQEGAWVDLVAVVGNYQRHCRHALEDAVTTQKLRVVIDRTNGDLAAAIYEIRCYT